MSAATQTYGRLLFEVLPQVIETDSQYDSVKGRLAELVRKSKVRTASETKLMKLLCLVVQDYDRRYGLPPDDVAPAERLRFLLEHSHKKAADLLPIFGQRSHVHEAINGKRPISAEQARKLGKLFSVGPGMFI